MSAPPWLAATTGYTGQAGQVNQFLGTHQSSWTYNGGTLQSSQTTGSSLYQTTASQYLSQAFFTGASQTVIGTVLVQVSTVGGSPVTATITPLTVSLYLSSSGIPTGNPLITTALTEQLVYNSSFYVTIPINITGLTPSTEYCIVISPAGTGTQYYVWQQNNQTSGGATSPDGVNWSPENFGFMYKVYDDTGLTGSPIIITDDGGAKIVTITYNTNGQPLTIVEQVISQSGTFFLSSRTFSYNGNTLIGVS